MKKYWPILAVFILAIGCSGNSGQKEPLLPNSEPIRERLPFHDRDLLLEPLILSLDDLRKSMDNDLSFETYKRSKKEGNATIHVSYKTHGSDTLILEALVQSPTFSEEFMIYYRNNGPIFYLQHFLEGGPCDAFDAPCTRKAKYYLDEDGSLLAAFEDVSGEDGTSSGFSAFTPSKVYLDFLRDKVKKLSLE